MTACLRCLLWFGGLYMVSLATLALAAFVIRKVLLFVS
jgi:hypothetical protein